jgi:hypothetical protein
MRWAIARIESPPMQQRKSRRHANQEYRSTDPINREERLRNLRDGRLFPAQDQRPASRLSEDSRGSRNSQRGKVSPQSGHYAALQLAYCDQGELGNGRYVQIDRSSSRSYRAQDEEISHPPVVCGTIPEAFDAQVRAISARPGPIMGAADPSAVPPITWDRSLPTSHFSVSSPPSSTR